LKGTVAGDTVTLATDSPVRTTQLVQTLPGATGLAVDGATVGFRVPQGSTALPVLLRAFVGDLTGTTVLLGVLAAVALSIAAVAFGIRTFQRESA
jgi:hypothetical protein